MALEQGAAQVQVYEIVPDAQNDVLTLAHDTGPLSPWGLGTPGTGSDDVDAGPDYPQSHAAVH